MKRRIFASCAAAGLGFALLASPAQAASGSGNGRIEVKGSCSASSEYRVRVRPIAKKDITRVQGKIDEGVAGSAWHVVVSDNGTVVFEGDLTTRANGELQKSAKLAGATGHSLQFDATNATTGETCSASVAS